MIKDIIKAYGSTNNLVHLRFIIVCLLGFSCFLRISELLNLKIGEMAFQQKRLEMAISKSKTDKLREGNIVYIANLQNLQNKAWPYLQRRIQPVIFKSERIFFRVASTNNKGENSTFWITFIKVWRSNYSSQ